jgi:hypothetical protein
MATTYTKIAKPTATTYVNVAKAEGTTFDDATYAYDSNLITYDNT